MQIIVAGCRNYTDYSAFTEVLDDVIFGMWDVRRIYLTIISGCAKGVDKMGERWATERDIELLKFPAKWYKYGKAAGPVRNIQMANNANALIAFWDGKSRGTKNMIEVAQKHGLLIHVEEITP